MERCLLEARPVGKALSSERERQSLRSYTGTWDTCSPAAGAAQTIRDNDCDKLRRKLGTGRNGELISYHCASSRSRSGYSVTKMWAERLQAIPQPANRSSISRQSEEDVGGLSMTG